MITATTATRQPTRDRLLDAGLRLFAAQGFRETTVGEIEADAGLRPRRGALYRHFASKEALLLAALERHLASVADAGASLEDLTSGDLRDEALAVGRWLLGELDRERPIVQILEQDGARLPELRDAFRRQLVDAAYVAGTQLARGWLGKTADAFDVEAMSAVFIGSLVNYRRSTWTFGDTPAGLDDDRFLASWADLCALAVDAARART